MKDDLSELHSGSETMLGYAPIALKRVAAGATELAPPESTAMDPAAPPEPPVILSKEIFAVPDGPASQPPTVTPSRSTSGAQFALSIRKRSWPMVVVGASVVVGAAVAAYFIVQSDSDSDSTAPAAASGHVAPAVPATAAADPATPPPATAAAPVAAAPATPPPTAATPAVSATATAPTADPPAAAVAMSAAAAPRGSCRLHVDANVAGGVVMIDGRVVGAAPVDVDGVLCGHRTRVVVAAAAFTPWERYVIPEEGVVAKLRASLGRPAAAIAINSEPSGATITLNGRVVGTTPAALPLVAGVAATISFASDGYAPHTETVVPHPGAPTRLNVKLVPAPLAGPHSERSAGHGLP